MAASAPTEPPAERKPWVADETKPPAAQRRRANRLQNEKSPYLEQHAYDLVDWYPWGKEAFERAKQEGKPVFLSSGFSTCHYCHVMTESFNDEEIAALLNENFVCVMVCRELRPDVDGVYMVFVQAVSGRGGWPMSVFLTPDLVPFVGSTYLPRERFKSALRSIASKWREDRAAVEAEGAKVMEALQAVASQPRSRPGTQIDARLIKAAFDSAAAMFDAENGGFGPPPKFPRPAVLEFLLGVHLLDAGRVGSEALDMVRFTLRKMARGGVLDQLAGGWHRYSVDSGWRVPHFEKMLYDQSQLASVYLHAYQITRDEYFAQVARATLDYVLRDMTDPETGGFFSAEDADSVDMFNVQKEKKEGAYYTWSLFELRLILGEPSATIFAKRFGATSSGNVAPENDPHGEFAGLNVLRVQSSIADIAEEMAESVEQVSTRLRAATEKLRVERARRPKPFLDDKIIVSWNGMMISALARAGCVLSEPRYTDAAVKAGNFLMQQMVIRTVGDSTDLTPLYLARSYRNGRGSVEAFAEDYACAAAAFIDLFEATGNFQLLHFARRLHATLDRSFWDSREGGYYSSQQSDDTIVLRRKEDYDGAEPSPSGMAALNCVRLASITGEKQLWERARRIIHAFSKVLVTSPLALPVMLVSAQALLPEDSRKVVITGNPDDAEPFLQEFWARGVPRSVGLLRLSKDSCEDRYLSALTKGQERLPSSNGRPAAYVCTGTGCLEPTTDVERFKEQLDQLLAVETSLSDSLTN